MIEVFMSTDHKGLKKNIWMKNYIGEEIRDGWDQTVRKSELKRRSYVIFCDCAKFGQDGLLSTC